LGLAGGDNRRNLEAIALLALFLSFSTFSFVNLVTRPVACFPGDIGSSKCPITTNNRITISFASSGTPSKYSLDADVNIVNGLTNTIARQGQFPANVNLFVYYVWCDTTVGGGNLILQQTVGAGWIYTFACNAAGGFASSGDPGSQSTLFNQALGATNQYDIVEANTNALADTMQGGFVVSTTNTSTQPQIPSGGVYVVMVFQIQAGQKVHVWYEAGNAGSCAAGTLVCWLGILQVTGGLSCKLDLSGGAFMSSGTPDGTVEVCTISPTGTGNQLNFRVDVFNGDTLPRAISGLFLISIF